MERIQFLPSYVGSKKHWIEQLQDYRESDIVELFCGSAVLSANLAKTAILNDNNKFIYQILSHFDELEVPETFTEKDYYQVRGQPDWWRHAYCLQKMSFSGVFRHSKNGYNVPIKPNHPPIHMRNNYERALAKWQKMKPIVLNRDYLEVPRNLIKDKLLILDPPYEDSQTAYNGEFDYGQYWEFVNEIKSVVDRLILFDREENLKRQNILPIGQRKMRVNGSRPGGTESIAIFSKGQWQERIGNPAEVVW
jgi:site-specific DNA-adenine methylase